MPSWEPRTACATIYVPVAFSAAQLVEADRVARELGTARFTVLQNHYSLLRRDDDADVLPLCIELGIS